jgi:NADPH-dependent 2,4-dienoyl-CoA reductase/sulfur reductase-like enzyme
MKKSDVVVVGGSAAGLTAAITARRHYPEKRIALIRKEKLVPIPCGIPYVFGTLGSPQKNLIPDTPLEHNDVEILLEEVVELDPEKRKLTTHLGEHIEYDKLILATGSLPMMPPIPGFDKENVFPVYKDVEHLSKMQDALKASRNIVVIGGGFIGVEYSDECNKVDEVEVTILELLPHCLQLAFDPEFCEEAESILKQRGVQIIANQKVVSIEGGEKVNGVKLGNGTTLDADMVVVAIGTVANIDLAKKAGIRLGPTGSIWVDRTMRTSNENIFACGDCAEKFSFFGGKPSKLKLASIACSEARIAGANLFGIQRENVGTVGVFSSSIDGHAFAAAGLSEQLAKSQGYEVICGIAQGPNRHPGSMPGMANQKVKLVFEKRTKVLIGAQISGDAAVGELVNVASACIQHRMNIDDIACFQMGTHPALTASPVVYQFVNAAESALLTLGSGVGGGSK